ncbi:MAG: hypothetical protein HC853_13470 [Anaerolineae bacterium]|nr:hypothetical protein [Anaerolineae bacterium]
MEQDQDVITNISPAREKFFGCSGKMLAPGTATVAAAIKTVPKHKLITTDVLRKKLADQFHVQACCPVTTQKALKAIASDATSKVAYWRVVKKNGELIAQFPGGVIGHAARLRQEGVEVDESGKKPKVIDLEKRLVD